MSLGARRRLGRGWACLAALFGLRASSVAADDAEHERVCAAAGWLRAWNATQHDMLEGRTELLAVIVRPHTLGGLGNRLRAINAGFFLAVTSGRVLVLDYGPFAPRSEVEYLRPRIVQWDALAWPEEAAAALRSRREVSPTPRRLHDVQGALASADHVVLSRWNVDPSAALLGRAAGPWRAAVRNAGLAAVPSARFAACAARALFSPSAVLRSALRDARAAAGAGARFDAAIHVRTNLEFERDYISARLAKAPRDACATFDCWRAVAVNLVACAAALQPTAAPITVFFAADDGALVEAVLRDVVQAHGGRVAAVALPARYRTHSGLTRAPKQVETDRGQAAFAAAGANGTLLPLVELLLVSSAHALVGTAGSSFSAQAVALGGFAALDASRDAQPYFPPHGLRPAALFRTAWLKGAARGDTTALELPPDAETAALVCAAFHDRPPPPPEPSETP
ncbi:hypothetical protein M885DRAFT_620248 [Pelagophyceae sp. CCMP2097]|nr:hypothetical protein M885DRAFT_620248 [Pelagophyceae sp. CCMP2097]